MLYMRATCAHCSSVCVCAVAASSHAVEFMCAHTHVVGWSNDGMNELHCPIVYIHADALLRANAYGVCELIIYAAVRVCACVCSVYYGLRAAHTHTHGQRLYSHQHAAACTRVYALVFARCPLSPCRPMADHYFVHNILIYSRSSACFYESKSNPLAFRAVPKAHCQ